MTVQPDLSRLDARDPDSNLFNVVIEVPRGSRNKFAYDPELGLFRLHKVLPLGCTFPYDFGFIPSTKAPDGDPIDVLVFMDEPAYPGCLVTVRLLGVIEAEQTKDGKTTRNDRLIAAVETTKNKPEQRSLKEISPKRLAEIEAFFIDYNRQEGKQFKPLRRRGPRRAERLIEEAMRQFEGAAGGDGRQRSAAGAGRGR